MDEGLKANWYQSSLTANIGVVTIHQMRPILLFSLILLLTKPAFAAEIGSVVFVDGQASALRRGGEVNLKVGSPVYLKDKIRTTTLGRVRVVLGDHCSVMLYGNSELNIESYVGDSKIPYIQFHLLPVEKTEDARTRMIVSQVKRPFECHLFTPNAILRGTEGDVLVNYSNRLGLSEAVTISGEIELSQINSNKNNQAINSVILTDNDLSRVTIDSPPSNPVELSGGQINRLIEQYSWPIIIPKITNRLLPWRVITKSP